MPHCCIEYTPNVLDTLSKTELLHTAHQTMLSSGLFGVSDVKPEIFRIATRNNRAVIMNPFQICSIVSHSDRNLL